MKKGKPSQLKKPSVSSTPYKIVYSKSFNKSIKKIDRQYHKGIQASIKQIAKDPYTNSDIVKNPNLPDRKSRKGDYRVFFNIYDNKRELLVITVMQRDKAYKMK